MQFFPNPDLSSFQKKPEEYLEDEIYLDVTDSWIVVASLRFDYNNRKEVARNMEHLMTHLTIGQYQNCRMPVVRPLTPSQFIAFIVRSFYHTAYNKYCGQLTSYADLFDSIITEDESKIVHMGLC